MVVHAVPRRTARSPGNSVAIDRETISRICAGVTALGATGCRNRSSRARSTCGTIAAMAGGSSPGDVPGPALEWGGRGQRRPPCPAGGAVGAGAEGIAWLPWLPATSPTRCVHPAPRIAAARIAARARGRRARAADRWRPGPGSVTAPATLPDRAADPIPRPDRRPGGRRWSSGADRRHRVAHGQPGGGRAGGELRDGDRSDGSRQEEPGQDVDRERRDSERHCPGLPVRIASPSLGGAPHQPAPADALQLHPSRSCR